MQPIGGAVTEIGFRGAARRVRFGRVDIRNTDLDTVHPESVAVDNAILPTAGMTITEGAKHFEGRCYGGKYLGVRQKCVSGLSGTAFGGRRP